MQKPAYFTNNCRIKTRTKKKATVSQLFEKYLLNVLLPLSVCRCAVTTKEDFSLSVTRTWSAHKWAKGATHNVILPSTTESWGKKGDCSRTGKEGYKDKNNLYVDYKTWRTSVIRKWYLSLSLSDVGICNVNAPSSKFPYPQLSQEQLLSSWSK